MTSFDHPCTEPGRWEQAPPADAPEADILAYLRHCDVCSHHARLAEAEDAPFDRLLGVVCRDLKGRVEGGAAGNGARPQHRWAAFAVRFARQDRPAGPPTLPERTRFERRLTRACLLAFGIVVLWTTAYAAYTFHPSVPPAPEAVAEEAPPPDEPPADNRIAAALSRGRLYTARVISDAYSGLATKSGVRYDKEQFAAAVPDLPFGSRLLVVNPVNGASVEVTVVDRGPAEGGINLSSGAAAALGFEGRLQVIVEVLSTPVLPAFGP